MATNDFESLIPERSKQDLEDVNKLLDASITKVLKLSEAVRSMPNFTDGTLSGGSTRSAGNLRAINEAQAAEREQIKLQNEIIRLRKIIELQNSEEYKNMLQLRDQRNETNKEIKAQGNAYLQLIQRYKELSAESKKLGAEFGTTDKRYKAVTMQARLLGQQLLQLEQAVGQNQRQVGNYNVATHEMSQLLRELPSFAYGAQTGISALSNNFPMFIDRLKQLKSEGMSNVQIIKQLGLSLFSFNNIITIAIAALTIFGGELFKATQKTEEAGKANTDYLDSIRKIAEEYAKEKSTLDELYRTATNVTLSYKERGKAVDELQKQFPEYFGKLDREKILNGEVKDTYDELTASILRRSQAQGRAAAIAETAMQLAKAEAELEATKSNDPNRFVLYTEAETDALKLKISWLKQQLNTQTQLDQQIKETETLSFGFLDEETRKKVLANEAQQKRLALMTEEERKKKDKNKGEKETFSVGLGDPETDLEDPLSKNAELERSLRILFDTYGEIDYRQTGLFANQAKYSDAEAKRLNAELEVTHEVNKQKAASDKKTAEEREKIAQQLSDVKKNLEQELFSTIASIGSSIYQSEINQTQARISNIDKEKQAKINQINAETISQEEKTIKIAQLEIGAARQKEQLENRQRELQRRQAQFEKAASIASIIAKTAEAVMSALKIPVYGAALAAGYGAIGALQLAKVVATPIPQYAEGTDFHPGGDAIVGEGGQPEAVITSKGATIVDKATYWKDLERGASVIPMDEWSNDLLFPRMVDKPANALDISRAFNKHTAQVLGGLNKVARAIEQKPNASFRVIGSEWTNYVNSKL